MIDPMADSQTSEFDPKRFEKGAKTYENRVNDFIDAERAAINLTWLHYARISLHLVQTN